MSNRRNLAQRREQSLIEAFDGLPRELLPPPILSSQLLAHLQPVHVDGHADEVHHSFSLPGQRGETLCGQVGRLFPADPGDDARFGRVRPACRDCLQATRGWVERYLAARTH